MEFTLPLSISIANELQIFLLPDGHCFYRLTDLCNCQASAKSSGSSKSSYATDEKKVVGAEAGAVDRRPSRDLLARRISGCR